MLWLYTLFLSLLWLQVEARSHKFRRQNSGAQLAVSSIPDSCNSVCSVFSTIQASSTNPVNLCTSSISSGLQSCSDCLFLIGGDQMSSNPSMVNSAQTAVNGFISACKSASKTVPSIRITSPTNPVNQALATGSSNDSRRNLHGSTIKHSLLTLVWVTAIFSIRL